MGCESLSLSEQPLPAYQRVSSLMFFFKSHMSTERDTSRDSNGLEIIGAVVGCLALGPIGALGLWAAGRAADKWVNENRDKYDPIN